MLLTTGLPVPRSDGDLALRAAQSAVCFDVIDLHADGTLRRLRGRQSSHDAIRLMQPP